MTVKHHIHVVQYGTDMFSTKVGPLCQSLAPALTNSGNHRRAFTCAVSSPTDTASLTAALNEPSFLTILTGHGGPPEPVPDWWVFRNPSNDDGCVSVSELQRAGVRVPADILFVDACYATRVTEAWPTTLVSLANPT